MEHPTAHFLDLRGLRSNKFERQLLNWNGHRFLGLFAIMYMLQGFGHSKILYPSKYYFNHVERLQEGTQYSVAISSINQNQEEE
jgi:hypothetical protein